MSLPEQYLVTTKNLESFLNSLINAQPPKKFTLKFLEQLEFKSTNDRLFIGVLKALNFIDADGIPQPRYYEFIDQTQSKTVLAEAIKEAYSDLFAVNKKANLLTGGEVKNKLKTLLQGSKSDNVLSWMAGTFVALCSYGDFDEKDESVSRIVAKAETNGDSTTAPLEETSATNTYELIKKEITTEMHYNIQIHLPETRDMSVYDAIFRSLKEHLL